MPAARTAVPPAASYRPAGIRLHDLLRAGAPHAQQGFTLVAVLSIALGIAVNAPVFGNSLPDVAEDSSIVIINSLGADGHPINSSYPDLRDIRQRAATLSGATSFVLRPPYLGEPPKMERVWDKRSAASSSTCSVKPMY